MEPPTLSDLDSQELQALPVQSVAADHAHLYLWTTSSFVVEAHMLAEAWGFSPKVLVPWIKTKRDSRSQVLRADGDLYAGVRMGMGLYIRHCAEFILFCVRGNAPTAQNNVLGVLFAPRGRHSEKPSEAYDLIDSLSPSPRLELFARGPRDGYEVWGNQANANSPQPLRMLDDSRPASPDWVHPKCLLRKVTPGDFFNIERSGEAGPTGGGGQLYIDIPLGGSISLNDFGNFVMGQPLNDDDSTWPRIEIQAISASTPIVAAPLVLTPRGGNNRRFRIANQNRQATGGSRHPAWSPDRGFPKAPDDVLSSNDPRMPDLSQLKVFLARTDLGEFLAGYSNSATMPTNWPPGIGLETLFEPNASVKADGIIQIPSDIHFGAARLSGLISSPFGQGIRFQKSCIGKPGLFADP